MRVGVKTLGCKVNQAESDLLLSAFRGAGLEVVDFEEVADCYVINSCAVTGEAERKTRQYVRRALRKNPEALVLLVGCCAKAWQRRGYRPLEERVIVLVSDQKEKEVCRFFAEHLGITLSLPPFPLPSRSRAWVKVEDGCDHFCSFCLVPYLREGVKSRSPEDILREVQYLEAQGVQEVVLCGTNLGYFGRDLQSVTLIDLLELLVQNTRNIRFRLSSLEPYLLSSDFLRRFFALGTRICPHLHLPLQSGSDRILAKMSRGYSSREYEALVTTARALCPHVAITTDVIVGFPGEEEKDFEATVRFCQTVGFSRMHVFTFSPRSGTTAFEWEKREGIPKLEKERRARRLIEVGRELSRRYHQSFVGRRLEVLVESCENGAGVGHSENYIVVRVENLQETWIGKILPVLVEGADDTGAWGRVATE
uniref:tRNA (N(6)-L-threonylcarbamoyladenosine(37)-C(2))-methylthiotransferase n=1 Tax=Candidatus Caldatribacterium californiense TaxID=1454726 RepID=A0A7V3YLK3_9BACT